jgi:LmbE family N-acetylglucosaminyl deacetylase
MSAPGGINALTATTCRTSHGGLRLRLAGALQRRLAARAAPLSEVRLREPAMIVAPHQDDETLGCGGTIAWKRRLGAEVSIVFLTDGSRSHPAMEPMRLREIREGEAIEAAKALGVDGSDVAFLRFPDSRLSRCIEEGKQALVPILRERRPRQIFVPHRADVYKDHIAANRIGSLALRESGIEAEILEYPVWLWRHWPYVNPTLGATREGLAFWVRSAERLLISLRDCRLSVDISETLAAKRTALEAHRSQVTRMSADWQVLQDVDDGEFLNRLMTRVELFCQRGRLQE